METLGPSGLALFAVVIVLSYAIRGSAGFGGITVPLLVYILSLKIVVPMVTFLGIMSSFAILATAHKHVDWKVVRRVAPSTVVGALIGLYFFSALDPGTLARALGALIIVYGTYAMVITFREAPQLRLPMRWVVPAVGSVAGFVGTLFGSMAGLFFAAYLDMLRLHKDAFRATASAILFGLGLLRGAGYIVVGAFDRDAIVACAAALPLMGIGVLIGARIHANMNTIAFRRLVALLLIFSGLPLLIR